MEVKHKTMKKIDQIAKEIWDMIQNRLEIYDLTKDEITEVFDSLASNCNDSSDREIDTDYFDEDEDDNFEEDWDDEE
jgi:hypothetical protein